MATNLVLVLHLSVVRVVRRRRRVVGVGRAVRVVRVGLRVRVHGRQVVLVRGRGRRGGGGNVLTVGAARRAPYRRQLQVAVPTPPQVVVGGQVGAHVAAGGGAGGGRDLLAGGRLGREVVGGPAGVRPHSLTVVLKEKKMILIPEY